MKSDFIYELLPHLYIIVGTTAVISVDPQYGRIAGVVLIAAGVLVTRMRLSYRKGIQK